MKSLVLLVAIAINIQAFSQNSGGAGLGPPQTITNLSFQKTLGNYGEARKIDTLNGFTYIGGSTNGKASLTKLDSNYNVIWSRGYISSGKIMSFDMIPNVGFVAIGSVYGMPGNSAKDAAFIMEADTNGHFITGKMITDSTTGTTYGNAVKVINNKIYFTGTTSGFPCAGLGVLLIKTDLNINIEYSYVFDNDIEVSSMTKTLSNKLMICGTEYYTSNADLLLFEVDTLSNQSFAKRYGSDGDDAGWSVISTSDNNIVAVGQTNNPLALGGRDIFVVKTNNNGDTLWTRSIGSTNLEVGYSIIESSDGYEIAGRNSINGDASTNFLTKISKNGNVLWSKTISASTNGLKGIYSIVSNKHNEYLLAGSNDSKFYLAKTDSSGIACSSMDAGMTINPVSISVSGAILTKTPVIPVVVNITNSEINFIPTTTVLCEKDTILAVDTTTTGTDTTHNIDVVSEYSKNKIVLYPNPVTNYLYVDNAGNGNSIAVYNSLGEIVLQKTFSQSREKINLNLRPGMYFYKFTGKSNNSGKLFVRN